MADLGAAASSSTPSNPLPQTSLMMTWSPSLGPSPCPPRSRLWREDHIGINPSPFQKGNVSAELFQGIGNHTHSPLPPRTPLERVHPFSSLTPSLGKTHKVGLILSSHFSSLVPNQTLCMETPPPQPRHRNGKW